MEDLASAEKKKLEASATDLQPSASSAFNISQKELRATSDRPANTEEYRKIIHPEHPIIYIMVRSQENRLLVSHALFIRNDRLSLILSHMKNVKFTES